LRARYEGQVIGGHAVVSLVAERRTATKFLRTWRVRCVKCGHESERQQRYLRGRACQACYQAARTAAAGGRARRKLNEIRLSAKDRGLEFDLTEADVAALIPLPCCYCGAEGPNGLDRVDSELGYEPGNVAPCCIQCNKAKARHTRGDFLAWARRVVRYCDATSEDSDDEA